jgi:hypothetical protein
MTCSIEKFINLECFFHPRFTFHGLFCFLQGMGDRTSWCKLCLRDPLVQGEHFYNIYSARLDIFCRLTSIVGLIQHHGGTGGCNLQAKSSIRLNSISF